MGLVRFEGVVQQIHVTVEDHPIYLNYPPSDIRRMPGDLKNGAAAATGT